MPAVVPLSEIGYAVSDYWTTMEYETTPELVWPRSVHVFSQMTRQDAQVASVLRAVTLPVRRTPWRIDPNGARPKVVQHVADDLNLPIVGGEPGPTRRSRDRFSWSEHLQLALLMLPYGHSFFEQQYSIDGSGLAHIAKLAWRPPRTIAEIRVARDGGLTHILQWGLDRPIPVDRLVAYTNDRKGGNWVGESLLRPAYKHWLVKDRLIRTGAQTVERNGMGVPLYTGYEGEHEKDPGLKRGLKVATAWRSGEAAGAAIDHNAKMELVGVKGTLPDAMPQIRYHDEQIARAVLAHFLNLGTQTGSWALGTTFADFFTLSLQTIGQAVADVATQHIVEDLVDLNWGPDEPAPRIVFDEIGSRQMVTAQALKALIEAGAVSMDPQLEAALRQQYGLPPKDPTAPEPPPADDPAQDPTQTQDQPAGGVPSA